MITRSKLISVWVCEHDDGTMATQVSHTSEDHTYEALPLTGYSNSSLLFEEVSSLVDALLWSWAVTSDPNQLEFVTGLE
jgi:hypothetical protein